VATCLSYVEVIFALKIEAVYCFWACNYADVVKVVGIYDDLCN